MWSFKVLLFFSPPWKLHTGFYFFFYFIRTHLASARNWRCPSLKVEKKGEEATAKEGRERGERKGGGERGVTRSACRRDQQRSTRSQSTHWCRDPKAATLFWNCAHFSVKSVLNTRNIWGRTGRAGSARNRTAFLFLSFSCADGRKCRVLEILSWTRGRELFDGEIDLSWVQGKLIRRDNTSDYSFIRFNWVNWLFDCREFCRLWGFAV